jgi:hypothetical protein
MKKTKIKNNYLKDKRLRLVYLILILWLVLAITAVIFNKYGMYTNFTLTNLAVYFVSLTTFVSTYLWGESHRSSDDKTPLFTKGPNSKREVIINITILLWFLLAIVGMYKSLDMNDLAVYFQTLVPFVGGYIISESVKKNALAKPTVIESKEDDNEDIKKVADVPIVNEPVADKVADAPVIADAPVTDTPIDNKPN